MCEALAWFPGERAWQSGTADRRQIRKDERLEALKRWLVAHNSAGAITRQEAVSMVPPLFLDVQPHHAVLDLCAAPGSKTSQLLEHVHAPAAAAADDRGVDARAAEAATGYVVANDADTQRACVFRVRVSLSRSLGRGRSDRSRRARTRADGARRAARRRAGGAGGGGFRAGTCSCTSASASRRPRSS